MKIPLKGVQILDLRLSISGTINILVVEIVYQFMFKFKFLFRYFRLLNIYYVDFIFCFLVAI